MKISRSLCGGETSSRETRRKRGEEEEEKRSRNSGVPLHLLWRNKEAVWRPQERLSGTSGGPTSVALFVFLFFSAVASVRLICA